MEKHAMAIAAACVLAASSAQAQNSVTLYGIFDNGVAWHSNQSSLSSTASGHSVVKMSSGIWSGSRFGLQGTEDLGGGTKAIFQLEQGIDTTNGGIAVSGIVFSRQAYVGLASEIYGTLTVGRQYTPYYLLLSPWSPTMWLTGYGAHPGDNDSFDATSYRTNNLLVYTSPNKNNFIIGGSCSLGGVLGSLGRGSTWSAAVQYRNGPIGLATGFQRVNNSAHGSGKWGADSTTSNNGIEPDVSVINNGYRFAQAQQRIGMTGGWQFTPSLDISFSYSNVQYIPGTNSRFTDQAVFNTTGSVLHWKPSTAWDLAGGYSYTRASKANGVTNSAQYHQINFTQYYALSKRTGVYVIEAYQHANGQTLGNNGEIIDATASIGDALHDTPSSSQDQLAMAAGIVHRF